jgi:hypothetical protein
VIKNICFTVYGTCKMSSFLEHILRVLSCPSVYSRLYSIFGALLSCLSVFLSILYHRVCQLYSVHLFTCLSISPNFPLSLSLPAYLSFLALSISLYTPVSFPSSCSISLTIRLFIFFSLMLFFPVFLLSNCVSPCLSVLNSLYLFLSLPIIRIALALYLSLFIPLYLSSLPAPTSLYLSLLDALLPCLSVFLLSICVSPCLTSQARPVEKMPLAPCLSNCTAKRERERERAVAAIQTERMRERERLLGGMHVLDNARREHQL